MRIFRTAGVFGLAVVFSLAMLVFLAACFFPAQSLALLLGLSGAAGTAPDEARTIAAVVSAALCLAAVLALPALRKDGALAVLSLIHISSSG